eukprot:Skav216249  [mRNA]  locus=scaffold20:133295:138540:- [translate_table: standard]
MAPAAAAAGPGDGRKWVRVETSGAEMRGSPVALDGTELIRGDVGMIQIGGDWVLIRRMKEEEVPEYKGAEAAADARLLSIKFQGLRREERTWRDVSNSLVEEEFKDWSVPGPRTASWCVRFLNRRNGGPMDHHRWWMNNHNLRSDSWGATEHETLCKVIDKLARFDGLDLANIAGAEVTFRRLQLIEKHARRHHSVAWADDAISALNSMYQGAEFVADESGMGSRASMAQRQSINRIFDMVKSMGSPPMDITGQGALSELRAKLGYDGQPSTLAQLQEDLVSLPVSGSEPASLEKILGGSAHFPCSLLDSKVLPPEAVKERKSLSSLKQPYYDPNLKFNRRTYASFIRKLRHSGVVELRKSCREQCGLFCVWKKSGRQRLVVDARLTNLWFQDPLPVALATGTAFGAIEVDSHGPIELAGVDISDAFYNIELPYSLRDLFGLRPLHARELGVDHCEGVPVGPDDKVFPVFRAVPMGWSHALWLCQYLHEMVVNDVPGLGRGNRFVDRSVPPDLDPLIHTEYVDNFVAFSTADGVAQRAAEDVSRKLKERGLPVHEVEAGKGGDTLGWTFANDSPAVVVTPRRLWRLRLATLELLRGGTASGHLVECILGHYTFIGLLCREFLSIFQATYSFCRKHYKEEVALWPQVRRELRWASSLLPLVRRNLSAEWSERVFATDASHWGRGVTCVEKDISEVKKHGRVNDRWKFIKKDEETVHTIEEGFTLLPDCVEIPRSLRALSAGDSFSLPMRTDSFVPLSFIGGQWKQLSNGAWGRHESIPILEGRAIVWVAQHLARSSKQHHRRHLILSDSMSCTLALSKGRSSNSGMNRVCRQVASVLLATGLRISVRWIPSELNPADRPSRGRPWEPFDVQEERAAHRERLYELSLVNMNPAKGPTFLEKRSITMAREDSYQKAWFAFQTQFPSCNLQVISVADLDARATTRVNTLFADGHNIADVHTLLAAIRFMRPDVKKTSDLTRASRASKGFAKLAPNMGRVPMPYPCLARVVQMLVEDQHVMVAFWLMLTWACCARPGEVLKLLWRHLVPPSHLQPKWMVILSSSNAEGKAQPSKVGEMDEAIVIDQPYLQWLGPALARQRQKLGPNTLMFSFEIEHGTKLFTRALNMLKGCVLEIFAGSGHFSRAMRRCVPPSVSVIEIDIKHGPQFDLTKRSFQRFVLGLLKRGCVLMVWLGTPCNSWSRARRGGGTGPPPLRNNQHIMGLPSLSEKDALKVDIGNRLMLFSAAVIRICLRFGIPVVMENPHTSMIWQAPSIMHLLHHRHVEQCYTDFCMEGCAYRKRTRLVYAFLDIRHCCRQCSSKRGCCDKSRKPHEQLVGTVNGVFRTKLAEPYPHSLCRRLARSIGYTISSKLSEDLNILFYGGPGS